MPPWQCPRSCVISVRKVVSPQNRDPQPVSNLTLGVYDTRLGHTRRRNCLSTHASRNPVGVSAHHRMVPSPLRRRNCNVLGLVPMSHHTTPHRNDKIRSHLLASLFLSAPDAAGVVVIADAPAAHGVFLLLCDELREKRRIGARTRRGLRARSMPWRLASTNVLNGEKRWTWHSPVQAECALGACSRSLIYAPTRAVVVVAYVWLASHASLMELSRGGRLLQKASVPGLREPKYHITIRTPASGPYTTASNAGLCTNNNYPAASSAHTHTQTPGRTGRELGNRPSWFSHGDVGRE